jgi:short-subunit dehydrogenase
MYVVITGATKGIGRALAFAFAHEGFNLAVCARNEQDLVTLQGDITAKYPTVKVLYKATDVSDKIQLDAFADAIKETCDTVAVLINNAGWFATYPLLEEPEGYVEKMMTTNTFSAYHLCRALAPKLIAQKKGSIFNICSVASFRSFPNSAAYVVSKHAMLGLSRALRLELMPHNIKVTSVCPGAVYTAAWDGSGVAEERLMAPKDIADAVVGCYKLSDRSVVEEIVLRPMAGDL